MRLCTPRALPCLRNTPAAGADISRRQQPRGPPCAAPKSPAAPPRPRSRSGSTSTAAAATTTPTGVGFFDHMLDQLARHALIDLETRATGDLHIDDHHTVEDIGIALGRALAQALGDKRGIRRYGACLSPMDDALVRAALDLSGRPFLVWKVDFPTPEDRQLRHRARPRVLHRPRDERRHHPQRRAASTASTATTSPRPASRPSPRPSAPPSSPTRAAADAIPSTKGTLSG